MAAILVLFLQVLFTLGAGWLLWKICRRFAAIDPLVGTMVGVGLSIRALLAQAMFWISYLDLPFARSLQTGDGFWSLAVDGRLYFDSANNLLDQGFGAVALVNKTLPSPAFLQILAVFQWLFGRVASAGSLLNLFAYAGACAAILHLGRTADGRVAKPALIAIAALSFAPAVIIWSVQPLKDPFFIFTIAAFVVACTMWQEAWREPFSARRFFIPLLLMLVVLYAVVGIRWYFGLLFWVASVPYFAVAAWRSNRRVLATVTNAVVFLALSQVIAFGARPYVPPQLLIQFGPDARAPRRTIVETVVQSRKSFDSVRGNTMIESGSALRKVDTPLAEPPHRTANRRPGSRRLQAPVKTASLPAPMSSAERAPESRPIAQPPRPERNGAAATVPAKTSPSTEAVAVTNRKHRDTTPATASQAPAPVSSVSTASQVSAPPQSLTGETRVGNETPSRPVANVATNTATPGPAAPVPARHKASHVRAPRPSLASGTKVGNETPSRPAMKNLAPTAATLSPAKPEPVAVARTPEIERAAPDDDLMPQSTFARVAAGLTAVIVPHFLGERLGLIHIGGGRGLWAIVETDTLFFDCLLLVVLYYVIRALPRGAWRNPSFWLVVISTAGVTVLLVYTVSNFGTLFRHRGMILISLCLLLVVARDTRSSADPLQEDLIAES